MKARTSVPLRLVGALSALVLLMSACGGGSDEGSGSLGEAASAEDADITIEVLASDPFEFDPDTIEVEAGQTVLFRVTNDGEIDHEFQIGSDGEGHAGHSMAGHLHLTPGETEELAWSFPEAGEVEFACHIAGHYESGMKGTLTVE